MVTETNHSQNWCQNHPRPGWSSIMAASNWLVNDSLEILYPLTIAEMDHYPAPHHDCCEKGLFHVYWSIKWSTADWKICLFLKRTKSTDSSFAVNLVTPEEFRLEISYIPNNKSHGLYLCPTQILKCSSNLISGILVNILKTSISTGVYPSEQWQRLFRFSNKMIILTLTIIGRLFYFFNFNRIFEKIVFKRMESFIEQKNLLTPS